jgi:hypothetical protein
MMLVEQNVRALAERHLAEANIDFGSVPIVPRLGDECLETANDRRQAKLPHYEVRFDQSRNIRACNPARWAKSCRIAPATCSAMSK